MATKAKFSQLLAYGVGQIPISIKGYLFGAPIIYFYNDVLGLEAWWASLALAIAMVVDGFTDPVLGYLSDYTKSRWGRRHPYIFLSIIPSALFFFLLLTVDQSESQLALFVQLLTLTIGVRIAWTFYQVPREALGAEISKDYEQRNQLHGFNSMFGWIAGPITAYLFLTALGDSYQNLSAYHSLAMWGALTIVVVGFFFAFTTAREIPNLEPPKASLPSSARAMFRDIFSTLNHTSWLSLFWSGVVFSLFVGLTIGLEFYWNTYFWDWKPADVAIFPIVAMGGALIISAFAGPLARGYDKKKLAIGLFLISIVIGPSLLILRLLDLHYGIQILPPNGEKYGLLWWVMLAHGFFSANIAVLAWILVGSMNADVVEDSQTSTGRRSEGLFFAGPNLIQKAISGVGLMAKGPLLYFVGFQAAASTADKTLAIQDLALVVAVLSVIMPAICLYLLSKYQITRAQHQGNLSGLGYRDEVSTAQPPISTK